MGFPGGSMVNNPLPMQETRCDPWVGKRPWRRKCQPTLVLLPGKYQELEGLQSMESQKSLTRLNNNEKDYNGKIPVNSVLQGK